MRPYKLFKTCLMVVRHGFRFRRGSLKKFSYRARASVGIALLLFSAIIGMFNISTPQKVSAATQPTTPTVPICGERESSDDEEYTGPTLQNPAYTKEISIPNNSNGSEISDYHYWAGGSGQDARWYIMQSNQSPKNPEFYVYDATNDTLINSFTISLSGFSIDGNVNQTFAVDSSGNIYINDDTGSPSGGELIQYLWSPGDTSATEGWTAMVNGASTYDNGAVYGYTDSNGVYRIGVTTVNGSYTFNASTGAALGTNGIVGTNVQTADAHNNDLVAINSGGNTNPNTIWIWNSTATTQTFYMSAGPNAQSNWMGLPIGASELADGTIVVTFQNNRVGFFTSSGGIIGFMGADYYAGQPLYYPSVNTASPVEVENGRIYYNSYYSGASSSALTYFTVATEQAYMASPQEVPFHLGLGASITTGASDNYFMSGTTPTVSLSFNQWWQASAANFTGTYTVRTVQQVLDNDPGTPQSFSVPTSASDYTSGTATVPLTLPAATPDMYEVNVQLSQGGTVVGADCTDYTVGAPNVAFNPSTLPSGTDTQEIQVAYDFGQRLYRSQYNLISCFPNVTTPTSSTTIDCPSDMISDIQSAATLAAQLGVTYEIQLGTGTSFDQSALSSGQWGQLIQQMVAQFPEVTYWECWNEPDNNSFSSAANYVTTGLEPCYNAVKAVSTSDKVVGISNDGHSAGQYAQYVNAGALNYLDIVAFHGYTGWNQSTMEQGDIIPSIYNTAGETGQLTSLQSYLASAGYTGPLFDTESGFWANTVGSPYNYYDQGDLLVTKMVLYQSVGLDWLSNFYNEGGYEVDGTYWGLMGGAQNIMDPGGDAALNYEANLGGRTFLNWLPTGIPHTYAALYGPSSTDSNDIVVTWADSYDVNAVPSLSGGGNMTVTDEYGATSTLDAGNSMTLAAQVQYIEVPAGQTLSFSPSESYGQNYALVSQGASATASSKYSCGGSSTVDPNVVLYGIDDGEGSNYLCEGRDGTFWAGTPTDTDPTLTITLGSPETIDRLFVGGASIGSSRTGVRGYTVQVSSTVGGPFTTVATVSNLFFNRNNLVTFSAQTVAEIQLTDISTNYSGYGDGLPPGFWASMGASPTGGLIYDVEAYSPGTTNGTPPTISTSSISNGALEHGGAQTIATTITPSSGNTITNAELLVDGNLTQTDSSGPYNFTFNPLNYSDGTHNLEITATDNAGNIASQYYTVTVNNGDINGDNAVNALDLSVMSKNWGDTGETYSQGDLNGDSNVNSLDLSVLAKNWGWSE